MNYQFCWYAFLKPLTFFTALLISSSVFVGVSTGAVYLLLFGIGYPVALCMRIHILSSNNRLRLRERVSEWIVYLPGIPVQETRHNLEEIAFKSPEALHRFYLRSLICKLILHALIFYVLYLDIAYNDYTGGTLLVIFLIFAILVKTAYSTIASLVTVFTRRYEVRLQSADSPWYEATFKGKPGLSILITVK